MFGFKRKIETYSTCNTDINYLEEKERRLEDLKGMKKRVIEALCEIDENFKYQYQYLSIALNEPFVPKNLQNYSEETKQHFKELRELQAQFDLLLSELIDKLLTLESGHSQFLKNVLNTENVKIKFCKNKYSEASGIIFLTKGEDIDLCQAQIEKALLNFYASKEYVEVLERHRTESLRR